MESRCGLLCNVAVHFHDPTKGFQVHAARIQRIRVKRTKKQAWKEMLSWLNMEKMKEAGENEYSDISIYCCYYDHKQNTRRFAYGMHDPNPIKMENIIAPINLTLYERPNNSSSSSSMQQ